MFTEPKPISRAEEAKEIYDDILSCLDAESKAKESLGTGENSCDEEESYCEDSYLAYLKAVRRAKTLTKKEFDKFELDAEFDCTYEELEVPEYEDYLKQ